MNRQERRALAAGMRWSQRVDPSDARYVLIEMRIANGGMPPASYSGAAAVDRIIRFCTGFLGGVVAGKENGEEPS